MKFERETEENDFYLSTLVDDVVIKIDRTDSFSSEPMIEQNESREKKSCVYIVMYFVRKD